MDFKNVVVGVDGSEEALEAVRWAAAQTERAGGELTILCAYSLASYAASPMEGGFAAVNEDSLKQSAIHAVMEAAGTLHSFDISIATEVRVGDPVSVLTDVSSECDLLVIGSRGQGGIAERLLGGTAFSVPALAKCPVVVVPPHTAGKEFTPVDRIVVGVDGSDVASAALVAAVDMGIVWQATVNAVVAVPIATGAGAMSWLPVAVDRHAVMDDIRRGLDMAVDQAVDSRDFRVSKHVLDGSPAALLAEFSTAVDLVVVGTRGRGGFSGMLMGSTSQSVLQHSTCPVMTVPSNHRDRRPNPTESWERR